MKPESKGKKESLQSHNTLIERFLKEGKSQEDIEELMGTPVLAILDIAKKMEQGG